MSKSEIIINGKQYPVIFTLATISNFEEITNQPFFDAKLNTINNCIALILASVLAADENTKLTKEEIMGNKDFKAYQQITEAIIVIGELSKEFFKVTAADKKADDDEHDGKEGQGKGKN